MAALAGPLNTKGIPADAAGIVHFDFDAGAKSKVLQLVKKQINKELAEDSSEQKEFEAFKKETGFDPQKDIHDATIAFFIKEAGAEPNMLVVLRGKFPQKKLNAAAQSKSATSTEGEKTFINIKTFLDAYGINANIGGISEKTDDLFCLVLNDQTAIVSDKDTLDKSIAAHNGQSYAAPADLVSFSKQVTNPMVVAFADGKAIPQEENSPIPPAESSFVVIGESAKDLQVRLALNYSDENTPAQVNAMAQMFLGFTQARLANTTGPDGQPDPEKVKQAQQVTKLLSSLKLAPNGKAFTAAFDYPSEEVVNFIKEQVIK